MTDLLHLTLVQLTEALRKKEVSPVELMSAVLARIEQVNPELNAVVARRDSDELLSEARAAERRVVRGQGRPLEGVPFGVKDLEDAAGLVTSHGAVPLKDEVAQRDSTQVARLKAAGAIVVGKTNVPEFGHTAITKNRIYGVTRSPWDLERTPGGSSGGSAAALAAEMLPLVTASDGGGSIRIPASFVGAYGHKPSFGLIPEGPHVDWRFGATTNSGALTKSVTDAALLLDQVAGPDPRDPYSLPRAGSSFLEAVDKPLDRLKIAYAPDLGYAVVQSDVAQVAEEAARVFETLGHQLESISGGPPNLTAQWGLLHCYEVGGRIRHLRPKHDADFARGLLRTIDFAEQWMSQSSWGEMAEGRMQLVNWVAQVLSEHDLLMTPTVAYDPPPAKGPFPAETEGRKHSEAGAAYFTIPFNLSWNPAATVRAGLSRAGLPVGLQIVAPHHRDDLVLRAARAFERERPWSSDWPMR